MIIGISRILRLIVITACCVYDLQAGVGTEPYLGWSFVEEGDVVVLGGTYKWSGMLFHYNASGGGTSQKPGSGIWEIPSHSYNGKPLVAIRDYSFEYWDGVEGFIIPSTVTNLSPLAFCGELIEGATVSYWTGLSSVTSLVFKGNAPDVKGDLKWALPSSTVYVTVSSSGWGVEIPGQWKGLPIRYLEQYYAVKFNANGGTGTMSNQAFVYGTAQNLTANGFSRDGYSFVGWATSANGAKVYSDKESVKNLTKTADGTVSLYAVWESAVGIENISAKQRYPWNGLVDLKFTITGTSGMKCGAIFTAKDMIGNTNVAMKTIRKSDGTSIVATEPILPGTYNWIWDASADLPKDFKCDRMTITGIADVSVYTVKFNANGGTGTMANQSFTHGTEKALAANAFTRTGYVFQGWATSANGAKVYSDKQSVNNLTTTANGTVNLYAVWGKDPNMVQLWNGGPFWAIKNVGADKPSDYGYYFWWGDTVGYKRENDDWVASDGSNSDFWFAAYKNDTGMPTYDMDDSTLQSKGWITADGVLAPEHDAAQAHWGGDWRMPTIQELEDLYNNCDLTWTKMNGVNGYIVRGRGSYSSNSIFLPCAGYGRDAFLYDADYSGHYWSPVTYTSRSARSLYFHDHYFGIDNTRYRNEGRSIRPVQSPTK